jgi:hypothetical protein
MAGFGAHWERQSSLARLARPANEGNITCEERQELLPDALEKHYSPCDDPQGHSSWFGLQPRNRSDPCNHSKNVFLAVRGSL